MGFLLANVRHVTCLRLDVELPYDRNNVSTPFILLKCGVDMSDGLWHASA